MFGASARSRLSPLFAVTLAAAFAACSLQMPGERDLFEKGESSGGAGVTAAGGARSAGGDGGAGGQVSTSAGEGGVADGGSASGGIDAGGIDAGGASDGGASDGGTNPGGASSGGAPGGGAGDGNAGDGSAGDGGAGDGGAGAVLSPRGGTSGEGGAGGAAGAGSVGTGGEAREPKLVAYFPFEDLETEVEATNVVDPRNSGTYHGDCTHPEGVRGRAVNLRNKTPTTDWVELPAGLLSELSALSLSIWVRDLSTARQGGRLFDFSGGGSGQFYFAPDESAAATPSAHLSGTHGGTQFSDLWASPPLTDKAWHHVAVTWSASSIELYIDGVSASRSSSAGVVPSSLGVTTENYLGRSLGDVYYGLYAELDELRIYDGALGPSEILELFQNP